MFIAIHTLKSFNASALNRGEDGAPKSVTFGGTWRGRISSQSLKRAYRRSEIFQDFAKTDLLSIRTRSLPALIVDELDRLGWTGDKEEVLKTMSNIAKTEKKDEKELGKTNQLLFLPATAPKQMAKEIVDLYAKGKKDLEANLTPANMRTVDVALWGAMSTSRLFPNVEAATQVAHAVGVNQNRKTIDYFVAVDDVTNDARMLGETLFNANCYYHNLLVDVPQLTKNLGDNKALVRKVVAALLQAVAFVSPRGKQNTMATHPLPDLLLVELLDNTAYIDYANAFATPVEAATQSLPVAALATLEAYITRTDALYPRPVVRFSLADVPFLTQTACASLPSLIQAVEARL